MPIDWSATGTMIGGLGGFASAAAIVWAAHRASDTLENWKRQKRSERKFEHAELVLSATTRVRHALEHMRSPLMQGFEIQNAERELSKIEEWDPAEDQRRRDIYGQALVNRIIETEADWDALRETLPLAKALFSDELESAIEELHQQRWIFRTYVDAYTDDRGDDREWSLEIRSNLNQTARELGDDRISTSVRSSIDAIERICLPVLRADPRG